MKNIYTLLLTTIAGLSTVLGNILLFIKPKYKDRVLSFSLGLSFIVMFLISVFELIPEGILLVSNINYYFIFIFSLFLLLIGYYFVRVVDVKINSSDGLYKIGFLSMISLLVHNIPEGIICAITTGNNLVLGLRMCFIIMIHNIPEGICISLPIYYSTGSKLKALLMTCVSSLGEITGALISIIFLNNYISDFNLYIILMITAGIMISLSIFKVLNEGLKIKSFLWLFIGILFGICIIILTV